MVSTVLAPEKTTETPYLGGFFHGRAENRNIEFIDREIYIYEKYFLILDGHLKHEKKKHFMRGA